MKKRLVVNMRITLILILIFSLMSAGGLAAEHKTLTVEDIMQIKNVGEPQLSPDGAYVAYVVSRADFNENGYNSDIWLARVDARDSVRLTNSPRRDSHPRWSPDGRKIAFISGRDGKDQVWMISPFGGEAEKITDAKAGVQSFEWSPDGKRIAFLAREPETEEEERRKKEKDDVIIVEKDQKMAHIWIVGLDTREARQITKGNFNVNDLAWSPDGKALAFSRTSTPKPVDFLTSDIYLISAEGGEPKKLVDMAGSDSSPQWSPDGTAVAFLSKDGKADWLANQYICLIAASGGKPRNLTRAFDESIKSFRWAADGRTIYFSAGKGVTAQLFSVAAESGEVKQITSGDKVFSHFSFSRDSMRMAFLCQEPSSPPEVCVSAAAEFAPVKLTSSNPQLAGIALGHTEVVRWQSKDGMEIEGLLIKPVGYERGKRYPLLVYVHGGPSGVFMMAFAPQLATSPYPIQSEPYPLQVFAGRGYAMLLPNPRGSGNYGEAFRRANYRDWGYGDFNDIMAGVDHLVELGIADPDRLGIMGWSYGGYMTSWTISQTDRLRAASVGAGVTNLYSMYGQTDIPDFMEAHFGARPWDDIEEYERHSAMFFAKNIRTPTLIQHGEKDERVPLAQGQELYAALKKKGVPVEFAVYPRQGHLIMEPKLQRDMLERNLRWFEKWVPAVESNSR